MTSSYAQDIEVGPVRVDTGNDWLDFAFVVILLVALAVIYRFIGRVR